MDAPVFTTSDYIGTDADMRGYEEKMEHGRSGFYDERLYRHGCRYARRKKW